MSRVIVIPRRRKRPHAMSRAERRRRKDLEAAAKFAPLLKQLCSQLWITVKQQ